MKVLMLVTYPEIGGTETHVLSLAKELRKYGVKVGLVTRGGPFVSTFRQQGIRVHKLPSSRHLSQRSAVSRIAHITRKYQYDIIHAHDTESFILLPKLKQAVPKIRLLMTVHGTYYNLHHLRLATHAVRRVIAVSPHLQNWLGNRGVRRSKIVYIPNGVDVQEFSPSSNGLRAKRELGLSPERRLVLYAGRFQSDKWFIAEKLIRAGERLGQGNKGLMILLVGPGSYGPRLQKTAALANRRLGRDVIYVRPAVPHIAKFYQAATLVVGTGRVALEAMASGKAVVAVGKGGFEGIVSTKSTERAIYDHFGDHSAPHSISSSRLASSIQSLLSHPDRAQRLGRYGRRVVRRKFSISTVAHSTYQLYRHV